MKLRMNNRDSRTRLHLSVQHVYGGEGGIRTLGTGVSPYNGLANRRIRPLCHLSGVRSYSLSRRLRVRLRLGASDHAVATRSTWNFFTARMPRTMKIDITASWANRNGGY